MRENAGAMQDQSTAAAAPDATAARPQVVYVMGSGRSGSTILGLALGNCDGVFYAGELDNWLVRSGTPVLGGLERTRFWSTVRDDVPGAREPSATRRNATWNARLRRFGFTAGAPGGSCARATAGSPRISTGRSPARGESHT